VSGQLHAPAALLPGKEPPGTHCRRSGGPQSRSVWSTWRRDSSWVYPSAVQPVASRYTDWAILAPRDGGILIQLLCFWTSIFLFSFKTRSVSATGFCLRLQVEPTQLGPTDRASPYLRTPIPVPRWDIQAQHKPSARVKANMKFKKLHTRGPSTYVDALFHGYLLPLLFFLPFHLVVNYFHYFSLQCCPSPAAAAASQFTRWITISAISCSRLLN
jgi:hypothetical protein